MDLAAPPKRSTTTIRMVPSCFSERTDVVDRFETHPHMTLVPLAMRVTTIC